MRKLRMPKSMLNLSHPDFNRRFRNFTLSTNQWLWLGRRL